MPLLLRSEEHTSELQSPCNLVCLFCLDRKSTRLNSSHLVISYAVFCLKKKKKNQRRQYRDRHATLYAFCGSFVLRSGAWLDHRLRRASGMVFPPAALFLCVFFF